MSTPPTNPAPLVLSDDPRLYDSGWIAVDWLPLGHTLNGALALRQGTEVTLLLDVTLSAAGSGSRATVIPSGFRPTQAASGGGQSALLTPYNSTAPAAQMYINSSGSIYLYGVVGGARIRQGITWQTSDPPA